MKAIFSKKSAEKFLGTFIFIRKRLEKSECIVLTILRATS